MFQHDLPRCASVLRIHVKIASHQARMDVRRATAYTVGICNFQIRIRLNESAYDLRQDISFRRRFRCDVNGIAFTILLHPHSA